jgi:hypothetical protein
MKINNQLTKAKHFAFDGCHKIYLIESTADKEEAIATGYSIYPISQLQESYENSCGLRFISDWQLTKKYVSQFEESATFRATNNKELA